MKYFSANPREISFEWNAATEFDWPKMKRLFTSAYLHSYKDSDMGSVALSNRDIKEAEEIWDIAFEQAETEGFECLQKAIINPLLPFFTHVKNPLQDQMADLQKYFQGAQSDISSNKIQLIKLTAIRLHFEEEFDAEKAKILTQEVDVTRRIHYLVARHQDQPVAFFACEFNFKSSRIYLRWAVIAPAFHRNGLGDLLLTEVSKHFPHNRGIELYTRKENKLAQNFYKHSGFKETCLFDFNEPALEADKIAPRGHFTSFVSKWLTNKVALCLPADEAVAKPDEFVGFYKNNRSRLDF